MRQANYLQIMKSEFFQQFTSKLCCSLDIKKALRQCALFINDLIPLNGIRINIIGDEPYTLVRLAGTDQFCEFVEEVVHKVPADAWAHQQAHLKSNKILLMDAPENRAYVEALSSYVHGLDKHSVMTIPLVFEGKPLGFFIIRAREKNRFTQEDVELFSSVQEPIAHAVAGAIRYEREQAQQQNYISVNLIFNRLKALKHIKTDMKLAKKLNTMRTNIANWRMRNSIPFDRIINYCQTEKIPMDLIFMREPFILSTKDKEGRYAAVLQDGLELLEGQDVEMLLKLPEGSLETYIEKCANSGVIPPVGILHDEVLSTFQKALIEKQIMGGDSSKMITIPFVSGTASDDGNAVMTERVVNFPISWAENHNLSKNAFIFKITSNNMNPTLQEGDMVLVEPEDNKAQSDGLYAVRLGKNIVARRLMVVSEEELIMICDNQIYPSAKLPFNAVVGKIIWFGREL